METEKTNFFTIIKENSRKIMLAGVLALIATLIVSFVIHNDFLLTNSFALEAERNNALTYFVKYFVIYIGIFLFALGVVFHNKYTLMLFCYCYLTLLFFLFFIKGIMADPVPQNRSLSELKMIDFSINPAGLDGLNVTMPILVYPILAYLMKDKKRAFKLGLIGIILIEPIQLLTNFGNFDINDTYENLVGYLFGVILYFVIYRIVMRIKPRQQNGSN